MIFEDVFIFTVGKYNNQTWTVNMVCTINKRDRRKGESETLPEWQYLLCTFIRFVSPWQGGFWALNDVCPNWYGLPPSSPHSTGNFIEFQGKSVRTKLYCLCVMGVKWNVYSVFPSNWAVARYGDHFTWKADRLSGSSLFLMAFSPPSLRRQPPSHPPPTHLISSICNPPLRARMSCRYPS